MVSALAISPHQSCRSMAMATIPAAAEISSKQLREVFLDFFINRGHQQIPSAVLHFDPYRIKVIKLLLWIVN